MTGLSHFSAACALTILGLMLPTTRGDALAAPSDEGPKELSYEGDVRPILKAHCFHCHGEDGTKKGGLDLRLRKLIVRGGESGPAVAPGDPDASRLFQFVRDGKMPKGEKKLTAQECDIMKRWIAGGATTRRPEPNEPPAVWITEEERDFWAFQPVVRPTPPAASKSGNPIDAFILAKLAEKGVSPSPEADKRTLIRRVYFDLLGLPPTPEDVSLFLADESDDAYERLIDRLLADPRYGERWGRHWLDVAGYAESDGVSEEDPPRPFAYKYRDYVIRSFNADKPFDQFVQEQLAGDEMVTPPYANLDSVAQDRLIATGFLRMAPDGTQTDDQKASRNQAVAETMKVVSSALLGLTVGCAQCHDHRYDPIPQIDYTRLRAIFDPAFDLDHWRKPSERLISLATPEQIKKSDEIEAEAAKLDGEVREKEHAALEKVFAKELQKVPEDRREAVAAARNTPRDKRSAEQVALLREFPAADVQGALDLYDPPAFAAIQKEREKVAAVRAKKPQPDAIAATAETPGPAPVSRLFYRGDVDQPRQQVEPGELTVLALQRPSANLPAGDASKSTTGRRLAYAKSLTDGKHPLVARVLVNRVWMEHLGRGIVATPADFGTQGERPTHPELLDWLASELVDGGWRLKRIHKLIMTSAAYRQASRRDPRLDEVDPDNHLLGRFNLRRLDAEALRDSMLAVSAKLNGKMFGPSVPVGEDAEGRVVVGAQMRNVNGENVGVSDAGAERDRRSVYVRVQRSLPLAMLDTFDLPRMTPNCEARRTSTVPPQALMLMNDSAVLAHADALAERLTREHGGDPAAQVRRAWALLYSTEATDDEVGAAMDFLKRQTQTFTEARTKQAEEKKPDNAKPLPDPAFQALSSFCQTLLGSNRFLYVE